MRWIKPVYSLLDGLGLSFDFSGLWRDVTQRCADLRKGLRIKERAIPPARHGLPAPDDPRLTAIELDIRNVHKQEIEKGRRRAVRQIGRARSGLEAMAIDVSDTEMKRIKAGHLARLAEVLTNFAGRITRLAHDKIKTQSSLIGFQLLNGAEDVPTARSALEWFAVTLATAIVEALVNAQLLKGELGYLDAAGFALGIGGAIALIGVAGGIGWAQLRRPRQVRRIGGMILFAAAVGIVLFLILGLAHYREALAVQSVDVAATAKATMAASVLAPLRDISLLPYVILNIAGFALVCWKSVAMWGFLDLKRRERAAAKAEQRFEDCKERARADCDESRRRALDLLDRMLELAEAHVEQGNALSAESQEVRDAFKCDASALADAETACQQDYRETVELVHPLQAPLPRFADAPPRLEVVELAPEEGETAALAALVARVMNVRDAMPGLTDEIGSAADTAIARIGDLAVEAEEQARGRTGSVLRFGKH